MRERERIEAHLSVVERVLRDRVTAHLTPSQRLARAAHLDVLGQYWRAGRFPQNHDAPGRVPCFIDEHGGRCAVAELLVRDGRDVLARRIAVEMKNHYLRDMEDPELTAWALGSGLDLQELAWIQPSYDWGSMEDHRPRPEIECVLPCALHCAENAPPVYEWDGQKLAPIASMPSDAHASAGAWGTPDDRWLASCTELLHVHGGVTSHVEVPELPMPGKHVPRREKLCSSKVTGTGPSDVWFVGAPAVPIHWDGVSFEQIDLRGELPQTLDPAAGVLAAVWAASKGEIWFGGPTTLARWKDGTLRRFAHTLVDSIEGTGPSDVWAVGAGGVLRWNGSRWGRIDAGGARFRQVIRAGNDRLLFLTEPSCLRFEEKQSCVARRAAACVVVNGKPPKATLKPSEPVGEITALREISAPLMSLVERTVVEETSKTDTTPALPPPSPSPSPSASPRGRGLVAAAISLAALVAVLLWLRSRRSA